MIKFVMLIPNMNDIVGAVNNVLWGDGQLLIFMLLIAGVWFSARLGLVQITQFRHMFSLLSIGSKANRSGISSFQALCTSLSARVGTGNLAGVAIAISLGGAGAIFWMWVIALLGMATGFAESLLGQVYKVRDPNGEFRRGPAYYIQQGLGKRWLAVVNVIAIVWLTPTIVAVSQHYLQTIKQRKVVQYKTGDCEIQGKGEKGIWD